MEGGLCLDVIKNTDSKFERTALRALMRVVAVEALGEK
jgi:hypothetical protein